MLLSKYFYITAKLNIINIMLNYGGLKKIPFFLHYTPLPTGLAVSTASAVSTGLAVSGRNYKMKIKKIKKIKIKIKKAKKN